MKAAPQFFATPEPTRDVWGFGSLPPAQGALLLVGWSRPLAFATDDGPPPFAQILAAALTRLGPLSFPTSEKPGTTMATHASASFAPWVPRCRFAHGPRSWLCLTREVAVAAGLFDDGAFPWVLQGQFGLLCKEGMRVEDIAALGGALDDLIEPGWSATLPILNAVGVLAVLRAGIDGDIAGLLTVDAALGRRIVKVLDETARQSSAAFEMLDEAGFAAALAAESI